MMSLMLKCCSGQQFRHDLRAGRFTMEFTQSAPLALQRINDAGDRSLILILSDINMPGMSGLELLPQARAARPDVPIIMITAYGDAETKRKALENGAEALHQAFGLAVLGHEGDADGAGLGLRRRVRPYRAAVDRDAAGHAAQHAEQ